MRKLFYIFVKGIFYISISISMFIVGNVGYYLSPFALPMSLCQINQNRSIYNKRQVHIRAYLEVMGRPEKYKDMPDSFDNIISLEKGCVVGASADYSELLKNDEILNKLRQELRDKNTELLKNDIQGWYFSEVDVLAIVDDMSHDGTTHCFAPNLSLKVKQIQQVAPIRFISQDEVLSLSKK